MLLAKYVWIQIKLVCLSLYTGIFYSSIHVNHNIFISRLQAADALLHGLEVAPVMAVLGQTPGHDTTQTLGFDNFSKLAGNERRGVPGPVDLGGGIPVPLPALVVVCLAVVHGIEEGSSPVSCLKCYSTGESGVAPVGVLKHGRRTACRLVAGNAVLGSEPLGVKSEAEIHLSSGHAAREVDVNGVERVLDRCVVVCDSVAAVHEVVGHDIDKVDGGVDLGDLLGRKGNHVAFFARYGNGKLFGANCSLDLLEEERVGLNLGDLARVGVLLVVLTVATRVLPVDVYIFVS